LKKPTIYGGSIFIPIIFVSFFDPIFSQTNLASFPRNSYGFIENKGQVRDQNNKPNNSVKYLLSLANGMNLQLKANSFCYDTYTITDTLTEGRNSALQDLPSKYKTKKQLKFKFHRVDISFAGASLSPQIIAEHPSAFYFNFTSKIRSPVRSYAKVTYKNLYPFIDLVFEEKNQDSVIEYYFVVRPGGNPNTIQWKYSGALQTNLSGNKIEISVTKGKIKEHIPGSFLVKDTGKNHHTQNIPIDYREVGKDTYRFKLSQYDKSATLVIDPTPDLIWGTYYGGDLNDFSYGVARDQANNLFICGGTNNASNFATSGAYQTTMLGNSDAILGKFDNNGKLQWMTYYGGTSYDDAAAIAVDVSGNIVITGSTFSYDGISTPGAYQPQNGGPAWATDAFLAKFDNNGNLLWGTYLGGEDLDYGTGVVTDASNNIFLCGFTASTLGIATANAYQQAYGGGTLNNADDGFISSFNSDGTIRWSTYYGGNSFDRCYAIALDTTGAVFVDGPTNSMNAMTSAGAYQPVLGGGNGDAFIAKFSNTGNRIWGTYYGSSGEDYALAIATDSKGNVLIGGQTTSTGDIASPGSFQTAYGGAAWDAFFSKFTNDGTMIWASYFGGTGEESINGITTDRNDNVFITGSTYSITGISTPNAYQPNGGGLGGSWTTFIAEFDSDCKRKWGTYYGYGGPYGEGTGYGITVDANDLIYVTGITSFTNNIATCGAQQETWASNEDIFLAKFGVNTQSTTPSINIISSKDSLICAGSTVIFTASAQNIQPGFTYQWLLDGNPVGADTTVFSTNQLNDGDSIRCLLNLSTACTIGDYSSNSIIIHIDSGLIPSVTINSNKDTICNGDSIRFMANGVNGGSFASYQWLVNGKPEGGDSAVFIATGLAQGDSTSCSLTRHKACTMDSIAGSNAITVYVRQVAAPSITIATNADTTCSGLPLIFTATTLNAPDPFYQWKVNGANVGADSNRFIDTAMETGDQVTCSLVSTSSLCPSFANISNTITEIIFPTPQITVSGDTLITKGGNTQLNAIASGNIVSFQWTPDSGLNNASISSPIASPLTTTVYTVKVITTDGCIAEKQVTITVITKISIPNAFTPNEDGRNDLFVPLYGSDISQVEFRVFNRWGQMVFEDNGSHKGWNGEFHGAPQPAGTYVWSFVFKDLSGVERSLKGIVELIR
jgi:gliding motility-associated-like protein